MNEITTYQEPRQLAPTGVFSSIQSFEQAQRMAQALASSELVPQSYKGNVANCLLALEVSQRCNASPLMVMQSLNLIQGRPSWSSTYIIAAINSCGRFEPLKFEITDLGEKEVEYTYWEGFKENRKKATGRVKIHDRRCVAWTKDRAGNRLESPPVTVEMAVLEGWYTKNDSKWKTMPDLMLRYRAASFFGRLYASEILMGMRSDDEEREVIDVTPVEVKTEVAPAAQTLNEKIKAKKSEKKEAPAPTVEAVVVEAEPIQGDGEVHF